MIIKIVFFLLFFCYSGVLASQQTIRLTNGEWPPYTSQTLYQNGFASDLVRAAFDAVEVKVIFGFFPWKRSYQYAMGGRSKDGTIWNGSLVWVYTPERARDFIYSDPVIIDDEVLFTLKSRPLIWHTTVDLKSKVIGGTAHTVYPIFEQAEKEGILRIDRAGNYDILFKRLLKGRIDAVPQVKNVAKYFLRTSLTKRDQAKVIYSPTIIQKRTYYLILNRKLIANKKLVALFNKGLAKIKKSGKYHKLLRALQSGVYDTVAPEF